MEEVEPEEVDVKLTLRYGLGKLVVGTIVGYLATRGAEKLYDAAIEWNRTRNQGTAE